MRTFRILFAGWILGAAVIVVLTLIQPRATALPIRKAPAVMPLSVTSAATVYDGRPVPINVAAIPGGVIVPVAGKLPEDLNDNYMQMRGGGTRTHGAIDIMAPRGTPVVAAADGIVEKLFFSNGGGGITAYVRSPDRQWIYYYAHLDAYAPGLREGARVRRGDPIGTVGSTGNANPAGPHLHFAIHFMAPGERWWQGRPINPYPLLAAPGPRR
jgi:murein DD-endopeptidase MepM/ murein hydrolase activator NlpD